MTKLTYKEQLLHPNWQRKRLEVLNRAEFKCERCHDDETTLHVHHKRYVKGRMAWEYDAAELVALCAPCHEEDHTDRTAFDELVASLPETGPRCATEMRAMVAGWALDKAPDELALSFHDSDPYCWYLGVAARAMHDAHLTIEDLLHIGDNSYDCREDFVRGLRALLDSMRPDNDGS